MDLFPPEIPRAAPRRDPTRLCLLFVIAGRKRPFLACASFIWMGTLSTNNTSHHTSQEVSNFANVSSSQYYAVSLRIPDHQPHHALISFFWSILRVTRTRNSTR